MIRTPYAQGVAELKRTAQHRIVRMVTGRKDEEPGSGLMDANGRKILRMFFSKSIFCWRPRRDLNPCYRQ